jgi:hypothetical protein
MRLHPAVTKEEATEWLTNQAKASWGEERLPELQENIDAIAEAMAIISAVELPDDLEPLFP